MSGSADFWGPGLSRGQDLGQLVSLGLVPRWEFPAAGGRLGGHRLERRTLSSTPRAHEVTCHSPLGPDSPSEGEARRIC